MAMTKAMTCAKERPGLGISHIMFKIYTETKMFLKIIGMSNKQISGISAVDDVISVHAEFTPCRHCSFIIPHGSEKVNP